MTNRIWKRIRYHWLDAILLISMAATVALTLGTGSNALDITFNLSVGVASAIFTFYLLVRLPELERKRRLKRHLLRTYKTFKRSVIAVFVGAAQGSYSSDVVDQLMNQEEFRSYFKAHGFRDQSRWDVVANKFDDFLLGQIILETEVLHGEMQYAISLMDIRDEQLFAFFKGLSGALYRSKGWTSDYDGTKATLQFFWQVTAGWNWVTGYSERDEIERMLRNI